LLATACASQTPQPHPTFENPPPLISLRGEETGWPELHAHGKRTLFVFMTPWCRACYEEQPRVESFAEERKADTRVIYVIAGSNQGRAAELARERGIELPVYADPEGKFSDYFNVKATPALALIDADGNLVGAYGGIDEVPGDKLNPVSDSGREIGTTYDVVVMAADQARARQDLADARKIVHAAEMELSEWKDDSALSRLNREAGMRPVEVKGDLLKIIAASTQVSRATEGAFDITWLPLKKLWDDAARAGAPPTDDAISETLKAVGYGNVAVEGSTVSFKHAQTRIGLGAVGKGWIVDAVFLFLRKRGYENMIVNIGGDLRTCGRGPDGPWTFTVMDPFDAARAAGKFDLQDGSVATSGNYMRYLEIAGKHYGHILDPRTGRPAEFEGSVSVFAPDCAMADALATALFVMGPEKGLDWARKQPGIEVIYATRDGLQSTLNLDD
jgi:thiamine biosynthesis lipoprotein